METTATTGVGPEFTRWAELTDAYAKELTAMQQGEPGARAKAASLACEIQRLMMPDVALMAPPRPRASAAGHL